MNKSPERDRILLVLVLIAGFCFVFFLSRFLLDFIPEHMASSLPPKQNSVYVINQGAVCDSQKGPFPAPPKIPPFQWKGTGLITLWFDDGWATQFTAALPMMEKEGFKGALSVAIKFVCTSEFMNWDQLRILQAKGWETTAHSVTHNCDLQYYTPKTMEYELSESKRLIEARGLRADQFVMPCGYSQYDIDHSKDNTHPQITLVAKEYFGSYRTTDGVYLNILPEIHPYSLQAFEPRNTTTDEEIKQLVQRAKDEKRWLILVFHQVDDSHRIFAVSPTQFQHILDIVKASGLPVVLPTQALSIPNHELRGIPDSILF
jgi:peptidoglycan/xylan/chitin deacetylase (PgdA/CDA1 family)